MTRSARLAVGLTLLAVVALLEVFRQSSEDPEMFLLLQAVFAVAASWLVVLGRPLKLPAEAEPRITKAFLPGRLVGGLTLAAGAALMLFLWLHIFPRIPILALLIVIGAIPVGLWIAVRSWTEVCRACRVPLTERLVHFNAAEARVVASAVDARDAGRLLSLHGTPARSDRTMLNLQYCALCLEVALLQLHSRARSVWLGECAKTAVQGLLPTESANA